MGEIAESILEGDMCEQCGEWIGPGDGYATLCNACAARDISKKVPDAPAPMTCQCEHASHQASSLCDEEAIYHRDTAYGRFTICTACADAGHMQARRVARNAPDNYQHRRVRDTNEEGGCE